MINAMSDYRAIHCKFPTIQSNFIPRINSEHKNQMYICKSTCLKWNELPFEKVFLNFPKQFAKRRNGRESSGKKTGMAFLSVILLAISECAYKHWKNREIPPSSGRRRALKRLGRTTSGTTNGLDSTRTTRGVFSALYLSLRPKTPCQNKCRPGRVSLLNRQRRWNNSSQRKSRLLPSLCPWDLCQGREVLLLPPDPAPNRLFSRH